MQLGDLGRIVTGKTPSTKNMAYWGGNIPFVTPKDIQGSMHIMTTERNISEEGLRSIGNVILPPNSVCVSCIGNIGYVGITTQVCATNQQINSIIVNDQNDPEYVYYLLKSLWGYFKNYEGQSTTLSILNKTQFSKIQISVPALEVQEKIAKILGCIDNKIELNNKINDNFGVHRFMPDTSSSPDIRRGRRASRRSTRY